ncbi:MAG: ASCH domain-containing protein [Clostridia bacterium]|nr:ASCH domain-containing protein [Clostridia bacterium]
MIYYMKLNSEPFNMIKSGQKTIELRLNDEKRKNIKIGDIIEFTDCRALDKRILTKVINIHKFNTFDELYKNLPLDKCGYLKEDIDTASPLDMEKYYSVEKQSKYGVLGIELEVLAY